MRSVRRLSAAALTAGLATVVLGLGAGPAHASLTKDCTGSAVADNIHSLTITTVPAAGSDVPAGASIQVTGHWDRAHWAELNRMATCVTSAGSWDGALGSVTALTDGIDSFVTTVTIPADMPVGTEVCVNDVLFGYDGDQVAKDTSDGVCFHSAAALVTPTTAAPTTTTTAPTTTTVATDTDSSGAGAGGPATPGQQVEAEVVSNPAPAPTGELPRTGSGAAALAGLGGLALAVGILGLALGRRQAVRA
jgi:hypothetical protein